MVPSNSTITFISNNTVLANYNLVETLLGQASILALSEQHISELKAWIHTFKTVASRAKYYDIISRTKESLRIHLKLPVEDTLYTNDVTRPNRIVAREPLNLADSNALQKSLCELKLTDKILKGQTRTLSGQLKPYVRELTLIPHCPYTPFYQKVQTTGVFSTAFGVNKGMCQTYPVEQPLLVELHLQPLMDFLHSPYNSKQFAIQQVVNQKTVYKEFMTSYLDFIYQGYDKTGKTQLFLERPCFYQLKWYSSNAETMHYLTRFEQNGYRRVPQDPIWYQLPPIPRPSNYVVPQVEHGPGENTVVPMRDNLPSEAENLQNEKRSQSHGLENWIEDFLALDEGVNGWETTEKTYDGLLQNSCNDVEGPLLITPTMKTIELPPMTSISQTHVKKRPHVLIDSSSSILIAPTPVKKRPLVLQMNNSGDKQLQTLLPPGAPFASCTLGHGGNVWGKELLAILVVLATLLLWCRKQTKT